VHPDGRELDYGYDATGARTTLTAKIGTWSGTTTTSYDASGRATAIQDPVGRWTNLTHDLAGQRTALTYPNGVVTTYGYDERGRVKTIDAVGSGSLQVTSFAYMLDASGRRTRVDEALGTTRTYGYDSVDRLTSETVTSAQSYVKTFTYDAVGNRQTQVTTGLGAGTVNYAYDMRDRLLTENGVTYGYNANGDVTSKSGEATYAWDFENRLTSVALTGDGSVSHVYDVDGNRMKTTVTPSTGAATVTNMLVDASGGLSQVVAETDGAGALKAIYVRTGNELLAVMRPAVGGTWTTRYVHHDALGSVRALTDEAGVVASTRGYEAFGSMNVEAGTDPLLYGFAGEVRDPASKLAYHRARWMDGRIGRFHGMDPWEGSIRRPETLHRYIYGGNDPVSIVDPTGRFNMPSFGAIATIVGIGATLAVGGTYGASKILRSEPRPLDPAERAAATSVFASSLNLAPIRLVEDPVFSVGGYARTPWEWVYFPRGALSSPTRMPWLIHELTHVWQSQHGIWVTTKAYYAILGEYSYGGEAGLVAARAAGMHFTSFNTEQQADIASHYYERSTAGSSTTAWQPFIDELRNP
jgi:RHS repeat-associated protein